MAGSGWAGGQTTEKKWLRTNAREETCGNGARREGRPRICGRGSALAVAFPEVSPAGESSKLSRGPPSRAAWHNSGRPTFIRQQLRKQCAVQHRDIVVIGASLGGVEALRRLVGALPPELPAAVLVVLHIPPDSPGYLPAILADAGPLPCTPRLTERGREGAHIYCPARPPFAD